MDLTCPKCRGPMRSYERSGITVDQCTECRGIFLDRGELERLVDAETTFHSAAAPPPSYGSPEEPRRYDGDRRYDADRRYDRDSHHKKHKRRSFLEELFD